eukprot:6186213-Pleurochrysis_carterae.AAC.1
MAHALDIAISLECLDSGRAPYVILPGAKNKCKSASVVAIARGTSQVVPNIRQDRFQLVLGQTRDNSKPLVQCHVHDPELSLTRIGSHRGVPLSRRGKGRGGETCMDERVATETPSLVKSHTARPASANHSPSFTPDQVSPSLPQGMVSGRKLNCVHAGVRGLRARARRYR